MHIFERKIEKRMKHYLIRAGMSPYENFTPAYEIVHNSIGSNVGNLVYAYSIFRTLTTEDVKLTPDYYKINPNRADYINANYDGYIIPLADAFRPSFAPKLKKYAELINRLTIPVYVIGVGLSIDFEPNLDQSFEFDQDVKDFVKAVLNKSSIIGVRGDITARYLTKLGFTEGKDHTVIGCPSMFGFGRDLPIRNTTITQDSMVTINNSPKSPKHVLDFIDRSAHAFPDHYYIPQWLRELRMIYLGGPDLPGKGSNFPYKVAHQLYQEDRVRYFTNVPSWLEFVGQADLSFGARLHGNVAAILAGTPSIIIPKDGRMRELAEYHDFTYLWANDIDDNTNILDVVEKADFQKVSKRAPENFDRYISFLNENGLDHVFKEDPNVKNTVFDQRIEKVDYYPAVKSFVACSHEELIGRWAGIFEQEKAVEKSKSEKKIAQLQKQIQKQIPKLKKEINTLQQEVKVQKATLNRKSVQLALKAAGLFGNKK